MNELDPLLYPLIFAALLLLNYAMQRIARWQKRQQSAQEQTAEPEQGVTPRERGEPQVTPAAIPPRGAPSPAAPSPLPRASAASARLRETTARLARPQVAEPLTRIAARQVPARALLAGRRNLRQAIVITTVLGPCRAQQPHDVGR